MPTINWPRYVLAALFIGYWLFARSLERVDGNVILAAFFLPDLSPAQAAAAPFSLWATFLVEMLHPRVLRHFIPVAVGWWLAVQAAISLMQVLYECPDRKTAAEFLRRQRRDRLSATEDILVMEPGKLAEDREKSILLRVGGPVRVLIPKGHAAVTERNARFLRVLSPGVHDLGRFEYLLGLIDLRPQTRSIRDVKMLSKEGIPLQANVELTFQLDPGEHQRSHGRPFPYQEEVVRKAAYAGAVGPGGKMGTWADGPAGRVAGALAGMVSDDPIDDLIAAPSPRDAHHVLTDAVMRKVWDGLPKDGIRPLQMRISRLTPPLEVSRQYTEYWLAVQRRADMVARANGTAHLAQEAETARAAAETAMIQAIVEGVRNAQDEAGIRMSGYLLALRLLEALRRMIRLSSENVQSAGGDAAQLMMEIDTVGEKLDNLQQRLALPARKFNPSRSD
jgi:regulator of protease activity HflC (stomatin/prohibitin superfamily)